MSRAVRFVQRLFLFCSLVGLGVSVVMLCIPPDYYTTVRVPDDVTDAYVAWTALLVLSLSGLMTAAVLYTYRFADEDGSVIIQR